MFKKLSFMFTSLYSVVFIATLALAADFPNIPDYSAEEHMETADGKEMVSNVYRSAGKERKEMKQGGDSNMIMIMRLDKRVSWMLMPESKSYMETKMDGNEVKDDKRMDVKMENEDMGEETINGIKTKKRKSIFTTSDGKKMGGFTWVTKEGIPVKQYLAAKSDDKKVNMKMELKNLKIGKLDNNLFEIPEGYKLMDMGSMFMGMGRDRKQKSDSNGGGVSADGLKNLKNLKNLFGK